MIVSHTARVLFVHVQKTGGSTIDQLLLDAMPGAERIEGLPDGRHSTFRQAIKADPRLVDYWAFGFVRNPWARLYSWHSMILRRIKVAEAGNAQLDARIERARFWGGVAERHRDFESFVLNGPDDFQRLRRSQLDYLRGGGREVDFVGRLEHFEDDLQQVEELTGIALPERIPHTNRGPRADYRPHYTTEMRDKVAEIYAEDVERFGYVF